MERSPSGNLRCIHCNSSVPPYAQFCGTCGERVEKRTPLATTEDNITTKDRYTITSLVRQRPSVQLFFATDTQHQRAVGIRDIDISSLDDEAHFQAMNILQQEYDLLRRQRIHDIMPVIDLLYHQEHLFTVAGWPFAIRATGQEVENKETLPLRTLQDLLQSGIDLPDERVALTWTYHLCRAVTQLHSHQIILGDLDPLTVVVGENNYSGLPALMVFWLPLSLRALLPHSSTTSDTSPFIAPEALQGNIETRSDIYSLGALLYLLLTGQAPNDPLQRAQHPLLRPGEHNPEMNSDIDALVMRALSLESKDRFQSASEMADALIQLYTNIQQVQGQRRVFGGDSGTLLTETAPETLDTDAQHIDDPEDVTISIVPLQARLAQWYQNQQQSANQEIVEEQTPQPTNEEAPLKQEEPEPPQENTGSEHVEPSLGQRFHERLSGFLPALRRHPGALQEGKSAQVGLAPRKEFFLRWLERLKRLLLSQQQHSTTAAALIETPLRVQPDQGYTIRIHLTGRDEPALPEPGTSWGGLRVLVKGEIVHIEVRSALVQNYAYIVQRADVQLPGEGYAAEVTIPMHPLPGPTGRHDRLHIFFMDELRRPLYEKPFVVEVLVSHLVQPGREGYNVLTIPF